MARGAAVERLFEPILREYSPEAMRLAFIATARRGIKEFIDRQDEPIDYIIKVNGAIVSSESSVPLGPATITYELQRLPQVGRYAYLTATAISPVRSGRYKASWFVLADNVEVDVTRIPSNVKELVIINDVPYARKIHRKGARIAAVPPGIVEKVRLLTLKKFGSFITANVEFHTLRGGYTLRTDTKRHKAGEQMTYPCVVIRSKV